MKKFKHLIIFLSIVLWATSCSNYSSLINTNLSNLYKEQKIPFEPQFVLFNHTKDSTQLFYQLHASELLYRRQLNANNYTAAVMLTYRVLPALHNPTVIDSNTIYIEDASSAFNPNKKIIGKNTLYLPDGKKYIIEIKTKDLHRNNEVYQYLEIDKTTQVQNHDFLILQPHTHLPYFKPFHASGDSILIKTRNYNDDKLYIWYQSPDFSLPPPPFSISPVKIPKYEAEKLFQATKIDTSLYAFRIKEQGNYQIKTSINEPYGKTLHVFYDGFPKIITYENMIAPLRFITTKTEFEELTENPDKRTAVEKFWIEVGQNKSRARELIKEFYGRVELANKFFSTYQEGWRSDRGMIYLIFGPPNSVYKDSDSESWVYGNDNDIMSINFVFLKKEHPLTNNLYILNRSSIYQTVWYRAVDMWRQGRIVQNNFQ